MLSRSPVLYTVNWGCRIILPGLYRISGLLELEVFWRVRQEGKSSNKRRKEKGERRKESFEEEAAEFI